MFTSIMRTTLGASLLVLAASIPPTAVCQEHRPSIGVLYFTLGDAASQTARNNLGISGNLGNDFSRELITRLASGHKFEVIDMSARPELAKEIAYLNGANIDPGTAARLGKEIGERMVLTGTITELSGGTDVKTFPFYKQQTTKVHVVAEVQVIDVETHAVLETANGVGDKTETKRGPNFAANSGISTAGTVYGNGPLHDATAQAFDQIVQKLEASQYLTAAAAPPPPPPPPPPAERHAYEGTVADVTGNTIIFTIPSADAAKVGDAVTVQRVVKTIMDPRYPNKVLRVITQTSATAKVTDVDAGSSTATAQISNGTIKVKDKISFRP